MKSVILLVLLMLPVSAKPALPETVQEAIEQCERMEYAEPQAAMRIAEHGLELVADMSDQDRGLLLACRAWSQIQLGEMVQARAQTLEIDQLARSPGEPRARVGLLIRLASLHYRGGDPISALEAMELALHLTEANGLSEDLPHVLGNMAIYLTESGQFASAIEHLLHIQTMAESEQGASIPLVPVRYNLARALLLEGRVEEALVPLEWLLTAMRTPGMEPRLATALSMMGSAWRDLGDTDKAAEYLDEAERLHLQFENPGELSSLRRDQALLARDQGDLLQAESHAREALALARQIEYERSVLDGLSTLVDILALRGQHVEALELLREYAQRKQAFLEQSQRSRLDALESLLGMQRQAQELAQLRQTTELQRLQLREESYRRRVAWSALLAVILSATLLSIWQRINSQRLLRISRTDALTGLANRRYLSLQMQSPGNDVGSAALMLLDLDHFKQVNDRFGHDMGDHVLREVSDALRSVAEEYGALGGRWGGEEFALFLADADADTMARMGEALRRRIAALDIRDTQGQRAPVSASLGFAPIRGLQRSSGQELWEPALKCADQLLYRAKHGGRNQGFGIWPVYADTLVNPLAMESALAAGDLRLIAFPGQGAA